MLISCMVTAYLICVFVFAYAKNKFSHDAAHLLVCLNKMDTDGKKTEVQFNLIITVISLLLEFQYNRAMVILL